MLPEKLPDTIKDRIAEHFAKESHRVLHFWNRDDVYLVAVSYDNDIYFMRVFEIKTPSGSNLVVIDDNIVFTN